MDLSRNQLIAIGIAGVLVIGAGIAIVVGLPEGPSEDEIVEDVPDKPEFPPLTGARADQIPARFVDLTDDKYEVVDGVKIHDLKVGTGKQAEKGSAVTVEYAGWLASGKPFDSSYRREDPFEFGVTTGSVIQGWHIGVEGMKEGGKRQLVIPPDKGYGDRGKGDIPPNSVLVFQVELLEVGPTRLPPEAPPEVAADAWRTLKPGLEVAVVEPGEGAAVETNSVVSFDMSAFSEDGSKRYASSLADKEPIEAVAGNGTLLPVWDLALIGGKAGGRILARSTSEHAYGPKGRGPIPGDGIVVFDLSVHEVGGKRVPPKAPTRVADYTTTEDGLKWVDLVEGTGASPKKGEKVWTEYVGWTMDGKMFDSSFKRPGPFPFNLHTGRVIKGWHKGVDGMKVGGKRQLVIPPELAYGKRGAGDDIPPDSTLRFEIELLSIGEPPE